MQLPIKMEFKLTDHFLDQYKDIKPKFGFNGLGEFVELRTYSRIKENGTNEQWWEICKRVVEGCYNIQKAHIDFYRLGWNNAKAQKSAQVMYDKMYNFKFLPPGRSLWAGGTPIVLEKGLSASLYNCSFVSTQDIKEDFTDPFMFAMDALMLGVGVGFDTKGAGKILIKSPKSPKITVIISDDREGWVASLASLLLSYQGGNEVDFDYSLIRPAGTPIKTFGGIAAGSKPLEDLHKDVRNILSSRVGNYITQRDIVDIMNLIGKAVVSGNVRRSALLALGTEDPEFLDLKDYNKNPERAEYGWASNNSVLATQGMSYTDIAARIASAGEPGLVWLDNIQKYSRMRDTELDNKDFRVLGVNPCSEVNLESYELCNLVELFPSNADSEDDFLTTIKYAYLYAKTITLLDTHWPKSNKVMLRNRRIGVSVTGIAQFLSKNSLKTLEIWLEDGYKTVEKYDNIYSEWFAVQKSKKLTTVKPSGTISILAGATPGLHYPESQYYIRRVRLASNSPFIASLEAARYKIEPCFGQEDSTVVVEFPVFAGENVRTVKDVSIWEQFSLAAFLQEHWSDNSVSVTISFDPKTETKEIERCLEYFQFKLKSVSLLPRLEQGAYKQMPYEEITKEQYEEMISKLKPLDFSGMFAVESVGERYCTNDSCSL